jgi:uncharacterized membrane protein YqjE
VNDEPQALPPPPQQSRLHRFVASFGHLVGTMIEMAFTRLELLFVDLQEWVEGLVRIFFWAMVMIYAGGVFLLIGSIALIVVFWDTHRVLVAVLEAAAFALLTLGAFLMMKRYLRVQRSLLTSTFLEFAKDRELFKRPPANAVPAAAVPPGVPPAAQAPPL